MALEDEVSSLTDRLDDLVGRLTPGNERQDLATRLEEAIAQNFGDIEEAISDLDGSGVEQQSTAEDVTSRIEAVVAPQLNATIETFTETIAGEVEGQGAEEVTSEVAQGTAEMEGGVPDFITDDVTENFDQANKIFEGLAQSADVSTQQFNQLVEVFGTFQEKIQEVVEDVEEGEESIEGAQSQFEELAGEVSSEFQDVLGEDVDNLDQIIGDLVGFAEEFSQNIQDATELSQNVQAGFSGQNLVEVGGALSEIGGGGLNLFQTAASKFEGLTSQLTEAGSSFEQLPNVGEIIQEAGTVRSAGEGTLQALNADPGSFDTEQQAAAAQQFQDSLEESSGMFDLIITKSKQLVQSISAAKVALFALAAPIALAADLLDDAFGAARSFREETGVGAERMRELRQVTAETSSELASFGLSPDATADIAVQLQESFGSIETATAISGENLSTLVERSGALAGSLGVSAQEAAEIQGQFVQLESALGGSAEAAAATTIELAKQNDVAPQAVIQDITSNSEDLAKFAGTTVDNLGVAAVEAQRLGINLGEVTTLQENLLTDVTGSVQKFQEVQQLTGQTIDSVGLIRASFQGTEATVQKLGEELEGINLERFRQNPFAAMALEDAFGISFERITTIVEGRRALQDLNTETEKAQALAAGDITFAQAVQSQDVDQAARLTRQFNSLYFVIAEQLFPVLSDFVESVLPAFSVLLRSIGPLLEGFAFGVQILLSPLQLLNSLLDGFTSTAEEMTPVTETLTTAVKALGAALAFDLAGGRILKFFGVADRLLPFFGSLTTRIGNLVTRIPLLGSALTKLSGVASRVIASITTALVSSGWGAIIVGIGAAIGGIILAFRNWEEVVQFTTDALGSFIDSLFGVENGAEMVANAFSTMGSVVGSVFSFIGDMGEAIGLDHLFGFIGNIVGSIGTLIGKFYEGKNAAEAIGSTFGALLDFTSPIDEMFTLFKNVFGMISDIGSKLMEGDFSGALRSYFEGVGSIGFNLIDMLLPDSIAGYIGEKVSNLIGDPIMSRLPQSPAEEGPLSNLGDVQISETVAQTIDEDPLADKMSSVAGTVMNSFQSAFESLREWFSSIDWSSVVEVATGAFESAVPFMSSENQMESAEQATTELTANTIETPTIENAAGENAQEITQNQNVQAQPAGTQAAQVQAQPAQTEVATVDQQNAAQPQQQQSQEEIRLDSDTDDVEALLQDILSTQQQFLQELRDGKIAVYLDGRKVNKELVSGLGFTG